MLHANVSTFYVDECLDSNDFVKPLQDAGLEIVRHRDILSHGVPDEVWIKTVSEAGYFALTKDYVIARNAYQTTLVMDSGLGLFIVRSKNSTHSEKGQLVVRNMQNPLRFINKNYRPYIATTTGSGVQGRRPKDRTWGQKYAKT